MAEPIQFLHEHVTVFTSALYQTNSVLIETPRAVFLVDPSWLPGEVLRIRAFVEQRRRERTLYLVFTHSDFDHILGYGAFPGARVIASGPFADKLDKIKDIAQIRAFDLAHYIERPWSLTYPEPDITIRTDGKAMHFSGTVLTGYLAPGHTREGMYLLVEPPGVWIAGDYLSDVEFPFVEDNIGAYRRTMAKTDRILRLHHVQWMVPGHGTVADSQQEILRRRDHALEYLDDLERAVGDPQAFPTEKYRSRYPFWEALQENHAKNIAHCRGVTR
ncbi:MAG: MBL fold metallo-hydrolase [Saprospiraceae bacterium]|nr:MBL fold metallo-hydrolase [Saprospiraceae bacterium]